jgi:hypothetical protein
MAQSQGSPPTTCGQCQHWGPRTYYCDMALVPDYREPDDEGCLRFECICGGNAKDGLNHRGCFMIEVELY